METSVDGSDGGAEGGGGGGGGGDRDGVDVKVVCTAWPSESVPQFSVVPADETKKQIGLTKGKSFKESALSVGLR